MAIWSHKLLEDDPPFLRALRIGLHRFWAKAAAMAMAGFGAGFAIGSWINAGMPMICH